MTVYTPILKLAQPLFDQDPWDDDVNNNMSILDSIVGSFFGIPNYNGVWLNDKVFATGQIATDIADGSMWQCAVANTAAAAPVTFAQDRVARPGYWTNTAPDMVTLAEAAATSAAEAAASAAAAAASEAATADKLPLAGGTMLGPLLLAANPTDALGAATKQYVDAQVGGVGYLPLAGGTMLGALSLSGNPTLALHAAPKQYIDTNFLAKTGGAMSGAMTVQAPTTGSNPATKTYVDTVAGAYLPLTGGTLSGNLRVNGGRVFTATAGGNPALVAVDTSSIAAGMYVTGTTLRFGSFDGSLNVSANWATLDGSLLSVVGGVTSAGAVLGGTGVFCNSTQFGFYEDSSYRWTLYGSPYGWQWNKSNGDLVYIDTAGVAFMIRESDHLIFNALNAMAGLGAYVNLSDERTKRNISPSPYGLADILQLQPVVYTRVLPTGERQEIGFVAQDVMKAVPEAVSVFGLQLPDGSGGIDDAMPTLGIASEALFAVAVNAIKELAARVKKLEA